MFVDFSVTHEPGLYSHDAEHSLQQTADLERACWSQGRRLTQMPEWRAFGPLLTPAAAIKAPVVYMSFR